MSISRIGGVYALLHAGHTAADYWVQTGHQAVTKGGTGWEARRACAAHVATLTATQAAFLALGAFSSGERLPIRRVAAGLAVNAASHYVADRREPLRLLAERLAWMGKDDYYRNGGAPHLDQAWHIGWCAVTAIIIGGGGS